MAVVAVQGREFAVPADGRALIVLVEDRGDPSQVLIRTHVVNAPAVDRPPVDATATREQRRERLLARMQQWQVTWHRWLDEEPLIQEFMSEPIARST